MPEDRDHQAFPVNNNVIFEATTQPCHERAKAATGQGQINGRDFVPIKLYQQTLEFEYHLFSHRSRLFQKKFLTLKNIETILGP